MRRAAAVRGPGSYDALKIVHVSLNKLKPADYNPRTMPEEELLPQAFDPANLESKVTSLEMSDEQE